MDQIEKWLVDQAETFDDDGAAEQAVLVVATRWHDLSFAERFKLLRIPEGEPVIPMPEGYVWVAGHWRKGSVHTPEQPMLFVEEGTVEGLVEIDRDGLGTKWTVSGDLRAPGSGWSDEANHDCANDMRPRFPTAEFDPESSCFYAYTKTKAEAIELANAIEVWVVERRAS